MPNSVKWAVFLTTKSTREMETEGGDGHEEKAKITAIHTTTRSQRADSTRSSTALTYALDTGTP
jgi:hypothetical protein